MREGSIFRIKEEIQPSEEKFLGKVLATRINGTAAAIPPPADARLLASAFPRASIFHMQMWEMSGKSPPGSHPVARKPRCKRIPPPPTARATTPGRRRRNEFLPFFWRICSRPPSPPAIRKGPAAAEVGEETAGFLPSFRFALATATERGGREGRKRRLFSCAPSFLPPFVRSFVSFVPFRFRKARRRKKGGKRAPQRAREGGPSSAGKERQRRRKEKGAWRPPA